MKTIVRRLSLFLLLVSPALAFAQEAVTEAAPAEDAAFEVTLEKIFSYGGTVLWLIVAVSILTLAYCIWLFFIIRPNAVVPDTLSQDVADIISEGDLNKADALCDATPSPYSTMARRAIAFVRTTPHADPVLLKEVVAGEGTTQATALMAYAQRLSHAISIAPMLGLLGTVLGMFRSFISISGDVAAAKRALLAQGMSQAIITTIAGLIVAIAASLFHAWFNYRAEKSVGKLSAAADELLTVLLSYQQTR